MCFNLAVLCGRVNQMLWEVFYWADWHDLQDKEKFSHGSMDFTLTHSSSLTLCSGQNWTLSLNQGRLEISGLRCMPCTYFSLLWFLFWPLLKTFTRLFLLLHLSVLYCPSRKMEVGKKSVYYHPAVLDLNISWKAPWEVLGHLFTCVCTVVSKS